MDLEYIAADSFWSGWAGFLPKFYHFQNSWLLPSAQGQAGSKTAQENGLALPGPFL